MGEERTVPTHPSCTLMPRQEVHLSCISAVLCQRDELEKILIGEVPVEATEHTYSHIRGKFKN